MHGDKINLPRSFSTWGDKEWLVLEQSRGIYANILRSFMALQYILKSQWPDLEPSAAEFQKLIARAKALSNHSLRYIYDTRKEDSPGCGYDTFEAVYNCYQNVLSTANALDFEDVLVKSVDLIEAVPDATSHLRHILVDELWVFRSLTTYNAQRTVLSHFSQDTSSCQYDLVKKLAKATGGHLSIVGDPDQSSELMSFFPSELFGWKFDKSLRLETFRYINFAILDYSRALNLPWLRQQKLLQDESRRV